MDLSAFIDAVAACRTHEALDKILIDAISGYGATALSGHTFPYGGDVKTARTPIISTWPPDVQALYRDRLAGEDPVMYAAMTMGVPVHFLDIERQLLHSADSRQTIEAIKAAGFLDVVGTPVYARPGNFAYFAAAFPEERPDLKHADLRRIKFLFSEYFYQHCELAQVSRAKLSPRERQVLVAIVNDKPNAEIAELLGVSEHTISTYVRRLFEKLDVNSRTQAVLRYLGGSMLDLPTE